MTDNLDSVSLFYSYSANGPGRLVENLGNGLTSYNYSVLHNPSAPIGYACLLQQHPIWSKLDSALCGPNLFVLPNENSEISKKFRHFLVPSIWVHNLYRQFSILDHATVDIWSVGIDTEKWHPVKKNNVKPKVLLYVKNRKTEELIKVVNVIRTFDIDVIVLEYGKYSEVQLHQICRSIDACVLLTGTESQGIAYMQILSCDVPCYVLNKNVWNYDGRYQDTLATSVPYFDNMCGTIVEDINRESFEKFLFDVSLSKFSPRSYVTSGHTIETSTKSYISLLQKYCNSY